MHAVPSLPLQVEATQTSFMNDLLPFDSQFQELTIHQEAEYGLCFWCPLLPSLVNKASYLLYREFHFQKEHFSTQLSDQDCIRYNRLLTFVVGLPNSLYSC